ncbi:hypothetical protein QR680_002448 [Steinernema hermaphroditum]|uniref:MOSC domain-containing protein n=1 Tax=Steinernema hermaphroditum TaxID=289476 RepID=A0AA39H2S6_9BILA|nr:hypothetical protein QR680_002448 [Steinernema hermaphroditum]
MAADLFGRRDVKLGLAVLSSALVAVPVYQYLQRLCFERKYPWVQIGKVEELFVYPIKSCKGNKVDTLQCGKLGASCGEDFDRYFLIVDAETNHFHTARQFPQLVLLESHVDKDILKISTPEGKAIEVELSLVTEFPVVRPSTLHFKKRQDGLDCGDDVAAFLTERVTILNVVAKLPRVGGITQFLNEMIRHTAFTDLAPYLAFSSASVDDLNKELKANNPENPTISSRNFRPNIVVSGVPPYDEDRWLELRIGETEFVCYKPCTRCVLTTVDPDTGKKSPDIQPLKLLREYRLAPEGKLRQEFKQSPIFGVNMGILKCGNVSVGDNVFARWAMMSRKATLAVALLAMLSLLTIEFLPGVAYAEDDIDDVSPTVKENIGKFAQGSKTDDETLLREEEAIKLDGLSVAQMKELRSKAEKHEFQAEVNRMMKLIINSLYRNKEIFLRELISNASDALDKIRLLSLTDPEALGATDELSIRIKADPENHVLHIIDTGIGMTHQDLMNNLGTIARSGTAEFLSKVLDTQASSEQQQDLIGQFGVGFYSAFLVADRVVVTTKHNDGKQYIWESDSASYSIVEDPRGATLKRGSQITLHLKEEAHDFLEPETLKKLVHKYSQFINFNIYLWESKTETVEEPIEEAAAESAAEDGQVEEEKEEKPKTKKVEKTVWDWERVNNVKPIWMRKASEVEDDEYDQFYKSITKDSEKPLAHVHFTAEGEVTFKSILYVPKKSPNDMFQNYGKVTENIKLYVRRVFITDDFHDMMPKYLSFIRGIVDSDDLPLNVSRENLQQHKLLKVIKKKLVRKVLDMLKKMDAEQYEEFWKEFSTNMKLGIMEDASNRNRLSKLLRFFSSNDAEKQTSLSAYVERMKEKQEAIFYVAGTSRKEVENSPFVERLLKKGYEVIYLTEPVDEYCIQAMPEFDGKKFQNVAKEGLKLDDGEEAKEAQEQLEKTFEPLTQWLKESALKDKIEKAIVSQRLTKSPSALVASSYGWSGNMERIMKSQAYAKANDATHDFYANQKKTFEINPRHPVVKELLRRVEADKEDEVAKSTAHLLFETATLRSGFSLQDQVGFAERIESVLRKSLDLSLDEQVEEEVEHEEAAEEETPVEEEETKVEEEHSEL